MFEAYGTYQASSVASAASGRRLDDGVMAIGQAVSKFHSLYWQAELKQLWSKITGTSRRLLDLDDVRRNKTIEGMYDGGCVTVEVAKIRGSECRVGDFDKDFLPLGEANRQRWASIYAARLCGVSLPAISLVQVGDAYYVRDGHHRVSVARLMGVAYMEANVQVWQVAGEVATAPAMTMQLLTAM